jgi:uncharacterized protein (DUF1778 family)
MSTGPANETINIRVPAARKSLIDRAAEAVNETRSSFMLEASIERAHAVLADRTRFTLSEKQMARFLGALEAPLPHPSALMRLLNRRAPWSK